MLINFRVNSKFGEKNDCSLKNIASACPTCVCVGLSVLIGPLLALDVVGGELGEQGNHVAARWRQSGVQHRGDGHLYHGSARGRGMMGRDGGEVV